MRLNDGAGFTACGPAFQRVQPAGRPAAGRTARPTSLRENWWDFGCTTLEPRGDEPVDGGGRVPELLVGRKAVARFHLSDQPAVVADFIHCRANRRPVV